MSFSYQPAGAGLLGVGDSDHGSSHHQSEISIISDLSASSHESGSYHHNNDPGDADADDRIHTNPLNNQISILKRTTTLAAGGGGAGTSSSSQEYWKSIEDVIESIPVGAFHSRILWICGVAFMADGMELSLLAFIATCAKADIGFTDFQTSVLVSLVFLGEFFGSLSFGMIADKFGRLKSFLFACFLISFAGILSGYAESYRGLLLTRMAVGFGVGGLAVPFDLVSEFSPTSHRGSLLVYLRGAHCLGAIYIAAVALTLSPSINWRVMAFVATLPVIIAIPCAIIFIPESPIWLLERKRTVDAEQSLRYVAFVNGTALPQFRLLFPGKDTLLKSTTSLFSPELLGITIPLLLLWLFFGFSYYGVVLFINRVFERANTAGDECSFRSYPIFWSAIAELIGLIITYFVIDKLGRISTQTSLYAGAAVSVLMLSMNLPLLALGVVATFARGTITSAIAATWTITPELYPTKLRSSGHSLANSFSRLGAFIVPYAIHNATNQIPAIGTGIALCTVNAVCVIVALFLPETLGKPLHHESRAQFAINLANSRTVRADSLLSESASESDRDEESRGGGGHRHLIPNSVEEKDGVTTPDRQIRREQSNQSHHRMEPFQITAAATYNILEHKDGGDDEKSEGA